MGTKTAPSFANTHMGKFVEDGVYGYPLLPFLLFSYTLPSPVTHKITASALSWWPPSTPEKTAPDELSIITGPFFGRSHRMLPVSKRRLLTAYKRPQNLEDPLVRAAL